MTNELKTGSPELIEDRVKKGTAFKATWDALTMVPSDISLRPDGITFDIIIRATPLPSDKHPDKTPEDRVRQFLEAATDVNGKSHGYRLGSLTIEPVKVDHPALRT